MFGIFKSTHQVAMFDAKLGLAAKWPQDQKVPIWISEAYTNFQKLTSSGADQTKWDDVSLCARIVHELEIVRPFASQPTTLAAIEKMYTYFSRRSCNSKELKHSGSINLTDQIDNWLLKVGDLIGLAIESAANTMIGRNHFRLDPTSIDGVRYRFQSYILFTLHAVFQTRISEGQSKIIPLIIFAIMGNIGKRAEKILGEQLPIDAISAVRGSQAAVCEDDMSRRSICTCVAIVIAATSRVGDYTSDIALGSLKSAGEGPGSSALYEGVVMRFIVEVLGARAAEEHRGFDKLIAVAERSGFSQVSEAVRKYPALTVG
ncbi:MAG: hypothetical protein WCN98_13200 [Verrucomicrobiaceae bacterium]